MSAADLYREIAQHAADDVQPQKAIDTILACHPELTTDDLLHALKMLGLHVCDSINLIKGSPKPPFLPISARPDAN